MAVPSPTADPRDALFYANAGAYTHQLANAEIAGKAARENAEGNYNYGTQQQRGAFKLRIPNLRNQANAQGLTESGINAQRQQQAATDYASKQGRIGEIRKAAIAAANRNETTAREDYFGKEGINLAEAQGRALKNLIENPPPAEPVTAAGGGPPGSRVTVGPGSPGQPIKAGFGLAESATAVRAKAANPYRKIPLAKGPNPYARRF